MNRVLDFRADGRQPWLTTLVDLAALMTTFFVLSFSMSDFAVDTVPIEASRAETLAGGGVDLPIQSRTFTAPTVEAERFEDDYKRRLLISQIENALKPTSAQLDIEKGAMFVKPQSMLESPIAAVLQSLNAVRRHEGFGLRISALWLFGPDRDQSLGHIRTREVGLRNGDEIILDSGQASDANRYFIEVLP